MLKPPECIGCPLEKRGTSFSVPDGLGRLGVVIVGEALGREEAIEGKPFRPRAQAGSKLEELFRLASTPQRKITRDDFLIWNVIACQPPDNLLEYMPYEQGAIQHCHGHFDRVVGSYNPGMFNRVILAMGSVPLKKMTGVSGSGKEKQSISFLRGYAHDTKYGPCVPTLHPSYLKRGKPNFTPLVVADIRKALSIAEGKYKYYRSHPNFVDPVYSEYPSLDECNSFTNRIEENEQLLITADIETPRSGEIEEDELENQEDIDDFKQIIMFQFSTKMGTGIAMPHTKEYQPFIKRILASRNRKAGFNWYDFDGPRIKNAGYVVNGRVDDIMWMFKMWQPRLPRGLQSVSSLFDFPFPWKHLYGEKLAWYGCADVDAPRWILAKLPKLMEETGVWKGYENHIFKIHLILDKASDRGIPVDKERMGIPGEFKKGSVEPINERFGTGLTGELEHERLNLNNELQELVPNSIKNVKESPVKKAKDGTYISYGYVREPKQVAVARSEYEYIKQTNPSRKLIAFPEYIKRVYHLHNCSVDIRDETTGGVTQSTRWIKRQLQPFKASSQQVIKYLKWKKGKIEIEAKEAHDSGDKKLSRQLLELAESYSVPMTLAKTKEGKESRETTGKKELEEMLYETGDEVLEKIMDIRSIGVNLSNFIPNWTPGEDGRVHARYGFVAPTGQKNWKGPNIVNASKWTKIGQRFRYLINAPKGYTFLEFDKKSFHVAMMGYQARSARYIRFSQLDPHTIFTSYIMPRDWGEPVDLSWSDSDILARCKEIKKRSKEAGALPHGIDIRQQCAKPTVLGNQLGLGPIKLQRQNRRFIKSIKEAEKYQQTLTDLFDEIPKTQEDWRKTADWQKFLYCEEWGFIQWFYDVYNWQWNGKIGKWIQKNGTDSEKVLGFMVQTPAFGQMDYELMLMEEAGINEEHSYLVSIHDSNILMPEVGKAEKCIEAVAKIMSAPCPVMTNEVCPNGLAVGVEAFRGRNWMSYDKEKNLEGMQEIKI